ncbi:MAG TPA: hypothetical protein VJ646_04100, partial [Candidatus Binatia bacterium]|nr:hypothetical protein [Candidatus Binatia bacterium]
VIFPLNRFYRHGDVPIFAETEYIRWKKEASRAAVDFYQIVGYLTGLLVVRPEMEPATLLRTASMVHILDAVLCRVVAGHNGRRKIPWTIAGLVFGVWALGILFLLPAKKTASS